MIPLFVEQCLFRPIGMVVKESKQSPIMIWKKEYKVDVYLRIPRPCLSPTVVSSVSKRPENQTGGE